TVQPVQVDIREDGADHASLRRSAEGGPIDPVLQISGLAQVLDQSEEAPIVDLLAEDRQQGRTTDVVEAPLDIALDKPLHAVPAVEHLPEGRVAPPVRSEPVTSVV